LNCVLAHRCALASKMEERSERASDNGGEEWNVIGAAVPPSKAEPTVVWGTARMPGSWDAGDFSIWPSIAEPPEEPDIEHEGGADDACAMFFDDTWLFLPSASTDTSFATAGNIASSSSSHPSPPAGISPVGPPSRQGPVNSTELKIHNNSVVSFLERGGSFLELLADPSFGALEALQTYQFRHLRSDAGMRLVGILLLPAWIKEKSEVTVARFYKQALKEFVVEAHGELTRQYSAIPHNERQGTALSDEAQFAMSTLVREQRLQVVQDLVLALEAFEIGKHKQGDIAQWLARCLSHLIRGALREATSDEQRSWKEQMQLRIRDESNELYGQIDVRAWPIIVELCDADKSIINGTACVAQIRLQLCSHSDLNEWTNGLRQAASLINSLGQADFFDAEDLCEIFNDKVHFDRRYRKEFLFSVLKDAPRVFKHEVMGYIDNYTTDLAERGDEEIQLVLELIALLDVDIRCCNYAYFQMQKEWLIGSFRSHATDGIIARQEFSPEQICDHIEDEPNYEPLLKNAVKELLKGGRKFEAARMLARQKSRTTSVFETNRNDKQLAYLVSLYQEADASTDQFGPVEQECLTLPCSARDVLIIDNVGKDLTKLEEETLSHQQPMALGIWWFWRCFNLQVDKKPRASFAALTYGNTFAIIDFLKVERVTTAAENKIKDVLCRILAADHILKVTHDIDACSLSILQRALIPNETYQNHCDDNGPLQHISPVIDLGVVVAFVKSLNAGAPAVSKLFVTVLEYLRLELCMAENLSNFDRRPLRQSQLHYSLTLAWSPLMILRAFLSWEVVKVQDVLPMVFRLGCDSTLERWDELLKLTWLCRQGCQGSLEAYEALDPIGMGLILDGPYGQNLWKDEEWVSQIPRPDSNDGVIAKLSPELLRSLSLSRDSDCRRLADAALRTLADTDATLNDLEVFYKAQLNRKDFEGAMGGS